MGEKKFRHQKQCRLLLQLPNQSSLQLDLDSCLTQLHCIALLDAGPRLLLKFVLGVGEGEYGAKNLAWVSPAQPRLPFDSKSHPLVKGRGVGAA
jgi:hypothetical protein